MQEGFKELKARFDEAANYKGRWLALYKDLYLYVIPNRDAFNMIFDYRDDGKPTTQQIWDNTAMLAAYQRANDLHGLLLPKDRIWGKFSLDPHIYPEELIKSSQFVMDEMNERNFFYIGQSNLSRVVSSSNLDLVGGTAAIWVESIDDTTPLYFRSIPAVSLYIEYSTDDLINTCWYKTKKSGRQILKEFPKYNGKFRERFQKNPEELQPVIYGQIKNKEDSFYIYAVLEIDPEYPLVEADRNYQQIIVYRDHVRPGECEGRGVGTDLLPSIQDLNRIIEYHRKSMAQKAYPPMFYDALSMINPYSIRQWAGAMIPRNPQGRNPMEFMETPHLPPDVIEHVRDLREFIKTGFQIDPLGEIESPVKSATEISIRENRAQRTSSTDISRLINELPKQIYEVSAKILNKRGLLVKDRKEIPGFNPKYLKFDYVSPLYDLQNQEDLNHFIVNMQTKQQFFGEGAAMLTVDLFEANNFLTEKLRLPRKLFASDEKLKQVLAQLGKTQQDQAAGMLPAPSTSASKVQLPQQQGVAI